MFILGRPIIADADVSDEGRGRFIAYSPVFVPGINTKWMRSPDQVLAVLRQGKPGQFIVVSNQSFLDKLDPDSKGKTLTQAGIAHPPTGIIGGVNMEAALKIAQL